MSNVALAERLLAVVYDATRCPADRVEAAAAWGDLLGTELGDPAARAAWDRHGGRVLPLRYMPSADVAWLGRARVSVGSPPPGWSPLRPA